MPWDRDDLDEQASQIAEQYTAPSPVVTPYGYTSDTQDALNTEVDRRIEKANLYKALRTQPLFAPDSASEDIIDDVTNEIRSFVKERLEELVGLRSSAAPVAAPAIENPDFDSEQILALQTLANKILNRTVSPTSASYEPKVKPAAAKPVTKMVTTTVTKTAPTVQEPAPKATKTSRKKKAIPGPGYKPMPSVAEANHRVAINVANASGRSTGSADNLIMQTAIQASINKAKTSEGSNG